jgi:hypothetical protein
MAKKPGRPELKPTAKMRRTVEEMRYCGESEDTIARALKISTRTLRKHFVEELADGHANRSREVLGLLFKSARSGNVSAQKKLEEMGRAAGAAEAVCSRVNGDAGGLDRAPSAAEPAGKKAERQRAAEGVTGKYAPPAGPRLAVDNTGT